MGRAIGAGEAGRVAPSARQANSTVRMRTKPPPQPGTTMGSRGTVPHTGSVTGGHGEEAEIPRKEAIERQPCLSELPQDQRDAVVMYPGIWLQNTQNDRAN